MMMQILSNCFEPPAQYRGSLSNSWPSIRGRYQIPLTGAPKSDTEATDKYLWGSENDDILGELDCIGSHLKNTQIGLPARERIVPISGFPFPFAQSV
jgi:hypothetical protein